jgi:NAD(P)H-flavin reductase
MAFLRGRITQIERPEETCLVSLLLEKKPHYLPGQYFKLRLPQREDLISATVFPVAGNEAHLQVMTPGQMQGLQGEEIQLFGAFGNAFTLPEHKSRIGVYVPAGTSAISMLPYLDLALSAAHEVTLLTDSFISGLLAEVEVLPLSQSREVFKWADRLVCAAAFSDAQQVAKEILPLRPRISKPSEDEMLVLSENPCSGLAACQLCALQTRSGWKHACKDGPVFRLAELGGV